MDDLSDVSVIGSIEQLIDTIKGFIENKELFDSLKTLLDVVSDSKDYIFGFFTAFIEFATSMLSAGNVFVFVLLLVIIVIKIRKII